jgi:hypothetical protein
MRRLLLLVLLSALFAGYATGQTVDRKVLYTLAPGETILYGEYMVDFASPNKNFVATIIKKANAVDYYLLDENGYGSYGTTANNPGHIFYTDVYEEEPYDIILNGERKHFNASTRGNYVKRPEKTISTSNWDDVARVWVSNGYFIRFHGLIYGPYDEEPLIDFDRDAFIVYNDEDYLYVTDGKESRLADQGLASMPMTERLYSIKGDDIHCSRDWTDSERIIWAGEKSFYYDLSVNGKVYQVEFEVGYYNFCMSANGKHWIISHGNEYYIDGLKKEVSKGIDLEDGFIDDNGNFIFKFRAETENGDDYYGFIINGVEKEIPQESQFLNINKIFINSNRGYRVKTIDQYAYEYKGDTYVFNGKDFVKVTSKSKNNYAFYPSNTYGSITIVSSDRRHAMTYGWELPSVSIDGTSYGKAPAITAEWNDTTKSFFWNALEGRELVVYECKP